MGMLEFIPVEQTGQIETVSDLARQIWTGRYLAAYGSMKLDYLLRTFQSPETIQRQIGKERMEYRLICYEGVSIGYLAFREKEGVLWVYHAYILTEYHGNRTVSGMLEYVEGLCAARGLESIRAVVDGKNDRALGYCERLGLRLTEKSMWKTENGFDVELYVFKIAIKK